MHAMFRNSYAYFTSLRLHLRSTNATRDSLARFRTLTDQFAMDTQSVRVVAYAVLTWIKGSVSNYLKHTIDAVSVAIGLSYGQSGRYHGT